MSTTYTSEAPAQVRAVRGEQPDGARAEDDHTCRPGLTPASTAPWYPVGKMSDSMVKSRSYSVPPGSGSRLKSANGTRRYSAWPPW